MGPTCQLHLQPPAIFLLQSPAWQQECKTRGQSAAAPPLLLPPPAAPSMRRRSPAPCRSSTTVSRASSSWLRSSSHGAGEGTRTGTGRPQVVHARVPVLIEEDVTLPSVCRSTLWSIAPSSSMSRSPWLTITCRSCYAGIRKNMLKHSARRSSDCLAAGAHLACRHGQELVPRTRSMVECQRVRRRQKQCLRRRLHASAGGDASTGR